MDLVARRNTDEVFIICIDVSSRVLEQEETLASLLFL